MQISHCPVCGLSWEESVDYKSVRNSFDICQCCGCEYGYDDTSSYREDWIESGAPWFDPNLKPKDWDWEKQLKNIVVNWDILRVEKCQ